MCVILALSSLFSGPTSARAGTILSNDPQNHLMQDCSITPDVPCIVSISAITPSGQVVKGVLTGRTSSEPVDGDILRTYDEYALPGLNFEAPAGDKVMPRVYYNNSWFQAVIEPSWLDETGQTQQALIIHMPHRPTDLYCGNADAPAPCFRNLMFNQNLTFDYQIRMPKSFTTAFVNARTDQLTYSAGLTPVTIDGNDFATIDMKFHILKKEQALFAPLLPNPLETSQYADFEIDQTIVNAYTPENPNSQGLGACAGTPSVTVLSDGLNPATPVWDPQSQTINVDVSAPHLTVNGDLHKGFFEAIISKEMGKCLWGIDLGAKTQAIVHLTEDSGSGATDVETVTSLMKGDDFILADANFHYSSPRISIQLANSTSTSNPAPISTTALGAVPTMKNRTQTPTSHSIKQLVCQKGAIKKKVTTKQCPVGYKLSN